MPWPKGTPIPDDTRSVIAAKRAAEWADPVVRERRLAGMRLARAARLTSDWPEERSGRLREMWAAGMTASAIADALEISKNSVIGRVHRMGLTKRPNPIKRRTEGLPAPVKRLPLPESRASNRQRGAAVIEGSTLEILGVVPRASRMAPLPIPVGAIPPARCCQWTDSVRAPWLFCDAPSAPRYSWCEAHLARVFREAA
jgi:GcrA cell cycle regulator